MLRGQRLLGESPFGLLCYASETRNRVGGSKRKKLEQEGIAPRIARNRRSGREKNRSGRLAGHHVDHRGGLRSARCAG